MDSTPHHCDNETSIVVPSGISCEEGEYPSWTWVGALTTERILQILSACLVSVALGPLPKAASTLDADGDDYGRIRVFILDLTAVDDTVEGADEDTTLNARIH